MARHNNDNQKDKFCNRHRYDGRTECNFYDHDNDLIECDYPRNKRCDGDIFKCKKLKYQWLASITDKEKEKYYCRS